MDNTESLADTDWDIVISGTGLSQSLLALALSRSNKHIIHVDANAYYGGPDAALSLQEAEEWAVAHAAPIDPAHTSPAAAAPVFSSAVFERTQPRPDAAGQDSRSKKPSFPRAYALALAPQIVHTRSALLSQLVSSRAFRQLEFLAVGSFFICNAASETLTRVPSTREDVFSATAIPARSKRALMKFLKFVLEYDAAPHLAVWDAHRDDALAVFLASPDAGFRLDDDLRAYIIALTLSVDGNISVADGLKILHRHLTSMGMFGPGFAAVYAKWGGGSEVAQVACRAGAVGGGIYMLGTGARDVTRHDGEGEKRVGVTLSNGITLRTKLFVRGSENSTSRSGRRLRRLVAVVDSPVSCLFEPAAEGSPLPAVAVVAFPQDTLADEDGSNFSCPIYALVHSSDTGECPAGQSVIYASTLATPSSSKVLEQAVSALLKALTPPEGTAPSVLCRLSYEQSSSGKHGDIHVQNGVLTMPAPPPDLFLNDLALEPVKQAWLATLGDEANVDEYLKFDDREAADDDDPHDQ